MQHQDRQQLISSITDLARALYLPGPPQVDAAQSIPRFPDEAFVRGLDRLLDGFLLESQPQVDVYATVLIADIRGFTALMSSLPMSAMVALLNRWFSTMTGIIKQFDGMVDKFVGDAVIALFGLPEPRGDDSIRALACAAAMQRAMLELSRELEAEGLPRIFVGIAVSTGQVVAGSFGSASHSEYTAIGDVMNLAARMESFALRGQILMSESTRVEAAGAIEVGPVNEVRFKGIGHPVQLYDLRALCGPEGRLSVPRVEVRRSPRTRVSLDATFRQIDQKRVVPERIPGLINDLSYHGLRADLPLGLPDASNVVISLASEHGSRPIGDVYARVVRSVPRASGFRTSLELTSTETPAYQRLKQLIDESLWRH